MPVLMIAVPAVGILIALVMRGTASGPAVEEQPQEVVVDPNRELNELRGEVPELQKEGRALMRDLRKDATHEVRARAKRLLDKMDEWMIKWDGHLDQFRDPDTDSLPDEYAGYGHVRAEINQLRVDILRMSNF